MENERMMTRIRLCHVTDTLASHHGQSSGSSLYLYNSCASLKLVTESFSSVTEGLCDELCEGRGLHTNSPYLSLYVTYSLRLENMLINPENIALVIDCLILLT